MTLLSYLIVISLAVFSFLIYFNESPISMKPFVMKLVKFINEFIQKKLFRKEKVNMMYVREFEKCPFCQAFWFSIIFFVLFFIPYVKLLIYVFAIQGTFLLFYNLNNVLRNISASKINKMR